MQQARNESVDVSTMPFHLVVIAGLPPQPSRALKGRIAALAHAGPLGRVHLILAGWRDDRHEPAPTIDHATYMTVGEEHADVSRIPAPVRLDPAPPPRLGKQVYAGLAQMHERRSHVTVNDLLPDEHWRESSVTGLSTVIGRDSRGAAALSLDDATPHWLIGGRTGGGKTVFLLDVLYGLAARYGPSELAMYLLDFKEGVSFTEFTPSPRDETWVPQVRAVVSNPIASMGKRGACRVASGDEPACRRHETGRCHEARRTSTPPPRPRHAPHRHRDRRVPRPVCRK